MQMNLIAKLFLLPFIFICVDLYSRFSLFYLYSKWQLFFYFLSLLVSAVFFAWVILFFSRIRKNKILYFSLLITFTFFLLVSFLGTYVFYSFNGYFPNFYTLLYFKTEPKSAFILLRDSINLKEVFVFFAIGFPVFLFLKHLTKQSFAFVKNKTLFLVFFRLLIIYFFLFIYHRKFDQCLVSDVNFAINIQRHFLDKNDHKTFSGKGHQVREPIKLKKSKKKSKFNVLVIVFESLRSDRLQAYDYKRETTPNLEQFRSEHPSEFHVFENPFTVSTTTMLAVPAILTGVGPQENEATLYQQPILWEYAKTMDYSTFFLSSHSMQWYRFYNFYKKNKPDYFWSKETSGKPFFNDLGIDDKYTVNHLCQKIKSIKNKNHFFGVMQLNSTHYPYNVPKQYQRWNNTFSDSYDNAVLYQDAVLKDLFTTLKEQGKLENTVIFFVSDHAESLKDHSNIGHVDSYYKETISIPLMVYLPEQISKSFNLKQFLKNKSKNCANTDIAPTIYEMLEIKKSHKNKAIEKNFSGHSLFSNFPKDREIITMNNNSLARFKIGVSLIKEDLHYLWRINVVPNREELYNFKKDKTEKYNLIHTLKQEQIDELTKNMRKYPTCRKFLRKYELF